MVSKKSVLRAEADLGVPGSLSVALYMESACLQACVQTQHITKCTRGIYCKDKRVGLFLVAFGRHSVNRTVVSLFKWLHMYNLIRRS